MHRRLIEAAPALEAACAEALDRRLLHHDPAPVAVALSGGGDSLALLHLAAAWAARAGRPLLALTVDHGLNPASPAWTAACADHARRAGAAFQPLLWAGPAPAAGLQAKARAARHALLAQAAREAGARVILLGHTADDVAETVALRRGEAPAIGRLREWAPSPAWPQGRGVFLLRPLLTASRAALRAWLTARGETWLDDPSNDDLRFARVRVRRSGPHPPPPSEEDDLQGLRRLAAQVRAEGEALALPLEALAGAHPVDAARLLGVMAVCAGQGATPRGAETRRLREAFLGPDPRPATLAGASLRVRSGLVLAAPLADPRRPAPAPCPAHHALARLKASAFQIVDEAQLRTSVST